MRIDLYLVRRGDVSSRERAQELIESGAVSVNGAVCRKNSASVCDTDRVEVTASLPYVGRGGKKLAFALDSFSLSLTDKTVLDIGASTGGFTDCALQRGAVSVCAVDVGHGQLAPRLRADARVRNLEGVHVRDLGLHYRETPDLICVDVSFLSLTKVLPYLIPFCGDATDVVALVKPQFEVLHKKSVIRDPKIHRSVLRQVTLEAEKLGFSVCGLTYSPIRGTEGNIEFLLYLRRGASRTAYHVDDAVRQAHQNL